MLKTHGLWNGEDDNAKTQHVGFENFQNKCLSEVSNILKICDRLLVHKTWSLKTSATGCSGY